MQWWIRPGPSRACAIAKPSPSPATRFAAGTRTSSKTTSAWPPWAASSKPKTVRPRTTRTPGVSRGTRTIDCCAVPGRVRVGLAHHDEAAGSRGFIAPVDHHLRPVTTYSSPSRSIRAAMLVASELATSGSVMQKADLIRPSSSGSSHRRAAPACRTWRAPPCSPCPARSSSCASGASSGLRPLISASGAYCRLVRPAPCSPGRKRFHRPRRRASALSSLDDRWRGPAPRRVAVPLGDLRGQGGLGRVDVLGHEREQRVLELPGARVEAEVHLAFLPDPRPDAYRALGSAPSPAGTPTSRSTASRAVA